MDVKVMYATGPGGVRVTIPLVRAGAYDTEDIKSRLKKAGIPDAELPYVVFSATEPPSPKARDSIMAVMDVPGVAKFQDIPPTIPEPSGPNVQTPLYSEIAPLAKVPVTPTWRQRTGCRYSMMRADGQGYVVMQQPDRQLSDFVNPDDWHKINDGRVQLCYGYIWHRVDYQFLRPGDRWDKRVEITHGMSRNDNFSITASVGYSGYGVSASVSATYGFQITVSDETKTTTEVSAECQEGSKTAALWELCRIFYTEVDGVMSTDTKPFQVIYKDKGGEHQLTDTWGLRYEVVSSEPTLKSTQFQTAAAG